MTNFPLLISFEKPFTLKIVDKPEDLPNGKPFRVQLTGFDNLTQHDICNFAYKMYNLGFSDRKKNHSYVNRCVVYT